jgi:hypothetical protein
VKDSPLLQRLSVHRTLFEVAGIYLLSALTLGFFIFDRDGLLGPDGFYHFRLAGVLWDEGLFSTIEALPLTVFGENLPDHHLLWHWLLIPFTWIEDPLLGVQWAAVLTGAMVPAGLTFFGRHMAIPLAPMWGLLAVCAVFTLPGRFVMLRAQNIAILLIFLSLYALVKERLRMVGVVAFVFMVTYHGAVILAPLVALYACAVWFHERRLAYKPFVAAGVGGLLGLIINPYFPVSFEYLYFHTVLTVPEAGAGTGGGSEWSAPPWSMLWQQAWAVHVLLLGAIGSSAWVARVRKEKVLSLGATVMVLAALLTLVMYKGANRFGEYYGPIGIFAAAMLFRDILQGVDGSPKRGRFKLVLALLVGGLIVSQGTQGLLVVDKYSQFKAEKYEGIAKVLAAESKPGDMVYNSAYHDFPFLYFHQPNLRYVIGLDTHYLSEANPLLFNEWVWMQQVQADDPNDPAPLMAAHFKADFAVVAREHSGLAARLLKSPHVRPLVATRYGWLFKITLDSVP